MALLERDCVLVSKSDSGQTIIDLPVTHVNNVEGLGRCPGTNYSAGDVVYSSSNMQLALLCATGGTSDTADLDISANTEGDTITDGTVVWKVVKRNYLGSDGVLPIANGGTGASTASQARTNLGIKDIATYDVLPVANGGTGATTAKQARENLEVEPIGTIFAFAGNNIPSGYLPCNGGAISRTTYADLFAVIGTTYGSGDGSTTFNLPNLNNNSFLEGSDTAGTVKSAGLPNIYGQLRGNFALNAYNDIAKIAYFGLVTGAFNFNGTPETADNVAYTANKVGPQQLITLNANNSSSIYRDGITTVQPKSVTVKFCIKY